ncbi:MAG TPA: copper homeostasis protein CutC [Spirochaetia bacterium]|nr:copper homeostasis protein CutC [Spirochaetia bacterium]
MNVFVEVCCGSVEDVMEAEAGGANRVELNSSLFFGGLTPTVGTLITAKKKATIPIMVMIRPRGGGFCYTKAELEVMERDIEELLSHGADGIVFGILDQSGGVDEAACRRLMARAEGREVVFHRAFDVMANPKEGLERIIGMGFRRILTTGRRANVEDGVETLRQIIHQADGRIEILPGGMVARNANRLAQEIGCDQIHISSFVRRSDPSARGNPEIYFGQALYPSEDSYEVVDRSFVRAVKDSIQ